MAKHDDIDDLWSNDDELGFGSSSDFDDGVDDISAGGKDDRSAIVRGAKIAGRSAAEAALTPEMMVKVVRHMFPKGIGTTIDAYTTAASSVREAYDKAEKTIGPSLKASKGIIARLAPKESGVIPKGILDKIHEWDEDSNSNTDYKNQTNETEEALNRVFAKQNEIDKGFKEYEQAREDVREAVSQRQHIDNIGILGSIDKTTKQLAQYTYGINARYQRAHLELTYRLLNFHENDQRVRKEEGNRRDEFLSAIAKNTSLPEFVKLRKSEAVVQGLRNKMVDSISGRMFGNVGGSINKVIQGIGENLTYKLGDITEGILNGLNQADFALGMSDAMGGSRADTIAQMAGGFAADAGGSLLGKQIGKRLPNSMTDHRYGISKKNDSLYRFFGNIENKITDFKNNRDLTRDPTSIKARILENIQDMLPSSAYNHTEIKKMSLNELDAPGQVTNRVNIAQHTVIPGYLARILREIRVWRTGEKTDLLKFDYKTSKFVGASDLAKSVINDVVNDKDIERSQRHMDSFAEQRFSSKDLSEESKKAIRHTLMTNSIRGVSLDGKNFAEVLSKTNIPEDEKNKIIAAFSQYEKRRTAKEEVEDTSTYNGFSTNIRDSRALIQQYSDLGYNDELRNAGIIGKDGYVDRDRIARLYSGYENLSDPINETAAPMIASHDAARHDRTGQATFGQLVKAASLKKTRGIRAGVRFVKGKAQAEIDARYGKEIAAARAKFESELQEASKLLSEYKGNLISKLDPENKHDLQTMPLRGAYGFISDKLSAATGLASGKVKQITHDLNDPDNGLITRGKREALGAINYTKAMGNLYSTASPSDSGVSMASDSKYKLVDPSAQKAIYKKIESSKARSLATVSKETGKAETAVTGDLFNFRDSNTPWVRQADILARRLYNVTRKKAVKSIHDLGDKIVDAQGNQVLAEGEAAYLSVQNPNTGKFVALTKLSPKVKSVIRTANKRAREQIVTLDGKREDAMRTIKNALSTRTKLISAVNKAFTEGGVHDVYDTRNPTNPVITVTDLEQGNLINASTGSVIKEVKDITGEVRNKSGDIVVRENDVKFLLTYDNHRKKMQALKPTSITGSIDAIKKSLGVNSLNASSLFASAKNKLISTATKAWDNADNDPVDIYVNGENTPRITATKMAQGAYIVMETNTVVTKPEDIQGTIIDTQNNHQVVISPVEIPRMAALDKKTGRFKPLAALKRILGKIGKTLIKGLFAWQFKYAPKLALKILKLEWKAAKFIFNQTVGRLFKGAFGDVGAKMGMGKRSADSAFDVYTKYQSMPALIGKFITMGYYFNKDGSPITKVADIKGEVKNKAGEIVLTDKEFEEGLLDVNGKRIDLSAKSLSGRALGLLGKGMAAGAKASAFIVKKQVSAVKAIGGMLIGRKKEADPTKVAAEEERKNARRLMSFDMLKRALKSRIGGAAARANLTMTEAATIKTVSALEDVKKSIDTLNTTVESKEEGDGGGLKTIIEGKLLDKVGGKLGKFGKVGRFASRLLGYGGAAAEVAGGAGAAATAAGAAGTVASGAAMAGEAAAGAAAVGGAAMTGAAGTVGALATGAMSFLASPVVLGVLAAGVIGYGAYKLVKYANRGNLDPIEMLRMVQYGFKTDDSSHIKNMVDLEGFMSDYIKVVNGFPSIDQKKMKTDELLAAAGVSGSNDAAKKAFFEWYQYRFKPVYIKHLIGCSTVFGKPDLTQMHGMKADQLEQLLRIVKFPDGPYNVKASPYLEQDIVLTNADDVAAQVKIVQDLVDKGVTKDESKGKEGSDKSNLSTGKIGSAGAGVVPAVKMPSLMDLADDDEDKSKSPNGAISSKGSYSGFGPTEVNGLDAVRFKAYGLRDLDLDKIRSIKQVELAVFDKLIIKGTNASWNGDVFELLGNLGQYFGIGNVSDDSALDWIKWFKDRFLPVYLVYASGVNKALNKFTKDIITSLIKPEVQLDIANQIVGVSGIWDVKESPWNNYLLNDDYKSCDSHINYLNNQIKKKEVSSTINAADKNNTETSAEKSQGFFGKLFGFGDDKSKTPSGGSLSASGGSGAGTAAAPNSASGTIGAVPSTAPSAAPSMGAPGSASNSAAAPGISFDTGGASTQADPSAKVPDIPPQTKGVSAVGPTVLGAAKLVGVNPVNAMTTVAMESGFDPAIKAKTSSAAGLYQFINATWASMVNKYGSRFGVGQGTPATDGKAASIMGSLFIKDNESALKSVVASPGPTDIYLAHFLGPGGAKKFLAQYKANPNAIAAEVFSKEANANRPIFYKEDKVTPRTYAEIYNLFSQRILDKAKATGLDLKATSVPAAPAVSGGASSASNKDPKTPALAGANPMNNTPGGEKPTGKDATKTDPTKPDAAKPGGTTAAPNSTPSVAPSTTPSSTSSNNTTSAPTAPRALPSAPSVAPTSTTGPSPSAINNTPAPSAAPKAPEVKPIEVKPSEVTTGKVNMTPFNTSAPQPSAMGNGIESIMSKQLDVMTSLRDLFKGFVDSYNTKAQRAATVSAAATPSVAPTSATAVPVPPTPANTTPPEPSQYQVPRSVISVKHRRYLE